MELRMLVLTVAILAGISAAQTTTETTTKTTTTSSSSSTSTSLSAYPGCYQSCTFAKQDYDPASTEELCDKERGLGELFLGNMKDCADCIREKGRINDYFDVGDAQEILKIVNLCQSLYTTDHSEMVSAMSVILETGSVYGFISPTKSPTSTSVPTMTGSSDAGTTTDAGSSDSAASTEDSSTSESSAWIAGPVVGSVAGVFLIIGAPFLIIRRLNRREEAQDAAEQGSGPDKLHEKPELSAEERIRHELDGQNALETEARVPPQELYSGEAVELPAGNGK